MATTWTDPTVTSSTHIRATHLNELRSVVNQNRRTAGLGNYSWTDVPVSASVHIRPVHFIELRAAIQDLWNHQGLGGLPNWSYGSPPAAGETRPISARDTTDLRAWVQRYQDATGISYQPVDPLVGPLRGLHLTIGMDMRPQDMSAAQAFNPGMVVVLNGDVLRATTLSYLKSLPANVEVFCRYALTTFPFLTYTTFEGYSDWLRDSSGRQVYVAGQATQKNPADVANDIIGLYDSFLANGLRVTRFYPGNEPELEWFNGQPNLIFQYGFFSHLWRDLNAYYRDVYYQLQQVKGARSIELYPPPFAQYASIGVGSYGADGSVNRSYIDGVAGQTGLDIARPLIEYYTNGTAIGRILWHNYFWPGRQAQHNVYDFFPSWLQSHIINDHFPARITEYGWHPDCFTAGNCPGSPNNTADLDLTTAPCTAPLRSINSWGDYNDFLRNQLQNPQTGQAYAGGAAAWLLSTADSRFAPFAAVDSSGARRTWFTNFISALNSP